MSSSKRSRTALGLALVGVAWISFMACGGSQSTTTPVAPSSLPPGCGLTLLAQQPQCEAYIDSQCCAQQDQCAGDADCSRIAQCWAKCDTVAMTMKKSGQEGACGCFSNCWPQYGDTPGFQKWSYLTTCLKGGFPSGMTCGSQC